MLDLPRDLQHKWGRHASDANIRSDILTSPLMIFSPLCQSKTMYSLVAGFVEAYFKKIEYKALVVGLDNSGKTVRYLDKSFFYLIRDHVLYRNLLCFRHWSMRSSAQQVIILFPATTSVSKQLE